MPAISNSLLQTARERFLDLMALILGLSLAMANPPSYALPSQPADIEKMFAQAMADYKVNAYAAARTEFQQILDLPLNQRYAASLLMLGKTDFQLHAYDKAVLAAKRLLRDFPASTFVDDGRFLLGQCCEQEGRFAQAAEEYLTILETDSDHRLQQKARMQTESLLREKLSPEDIRKLSGTFPESTLLKQTAPPAASRFRIGVISPLTGDESDVGNEMVQGVRLALGQSDLSNVEIVVENSDTDPILAVLAAQKLAAQESVIAIIGPVQSALTVGAAAVANGQQIVLITPTATEDGLTDIGPYIFQLNVTPKTQGAALADFAIDRLGLKRFAVLAISDSYGRQSAQAFVSGVERWGGFILAQEWYYEGATDFTPQLSHIREAGLALEMADSLAWAGKLSNLKTSGLVDTTAEELVPPADSIDGLFIAAYAEDIPLIASQVAFQRIRTQLLGTNSWNSEEVVQNGGSYVEGAIFAADFHRGQPTEQYLRFQDGYWEEYGMTPTRVAALGYDAMRLILAAIEQGITSAAELRERLAETRRFEGASGTIVFHPDRRINANVYFLTIRNGNIIESP